MSEDKLLAKLNDLPEVIGLSDFKMRHDALLAVIKLHGYDREWDLCLVCDDSDYPCATLQAIAKCLHE